MSGFCTKIWKATWWYVWILQISQNLEANLMLCPDYANFTQSGSQPDGISGFYKFYKIWKQTWWFLRILQILQNLVVSKKSQLPCNNGVQLLYQPTDIFWEVKAACIIGRKIKQPKRATSTMFPTSSTWNWKQTFQWCCWWCVALKLVCFMVPEQQATAWLTTKRYQTRMDLNSQYMNMPHRERIKSHSTPVLWLPPFTTLQDWKTCVKTHQG